MIELNVFLTLYSGDHRFDDNEQCGGFDAATGGAGRAADKDGQQYQEDS